MIQLIALTLSLATTPVQSLADTICEEVRTVLQESVKDGVLTNKEAREITVRCFFSDLTSPEWYVFHYSYPHPL